MLKITHEKYKTNKKGNNEAFNEFVQSFDEAIEHNKELEPLVLKAQETLTPQMVLNMFRQIPVKVSALVSYTLSCLINGRGVLKWGLFTSSVATTAKRIIPYLRKY